MSVYNLEGPSWSSSVVTYSFANGGGNFTSSVSAPYQAVIQAALSRWAQVANINFQQVTDSASTNIRIGWGSFAGSQVGQTDYSYTSSDNRFTNGVTVRLEDPALSAVAANTTADYSGTATSLYQVALHEIGHALGLAHDTDPNSVMYAMLGRANLDLDQTDIDGIRALFGPAANATTNAGTTTASTKAAITPQTTALLNVTVPNGQVAVYRFFDSTSGTQFLTGSMSEASTLITTRQDLHFEGLGMGGIASGSSDPNAVSVFRFFDTTNGTHFFTTDANEANTIGKTRADLVAEGASFMEHQTAESGDTAVYRFFNANNGTHFFTNSATEQATIMSTRPDMHSEGIAFYAPTV